MTTKFSFWAYGILSIAALSMFLYVVTSVGGYPQVGFPLLGITVFIVIMFVFYMFAKLFARRY